MEGRIAELEAKIAVLEAAVRTGSKGTVKAADTEYGFVSKLDGEDKLQAQTLIQENASLKEKLEHLTDIVEQRDYQIMHLRQALDRLIPK